MVLVPFLSRLYARFTGPRALSVGTKAEFLGMWVSPNVDDPRKLQEGQDPQKEKKALRILSIWVGFGWWELEDTQGQD